jgi:3-oxoadipate enol-lactonase/4-carboxymuconolactone decarboxylase
VWSALAPRLRGQARVTAFDWPGMGYSDAWPGGATPDHMADRLRALLDAWGMERASILAMDMGGQPALSFAARHPDRVDRLVVMNSLVWWDQPTSWEIGLLRRFGWNRFLLRRAGRLVFERAVRTSLPSRVRLPRELRADLWGAFRRPEVRAFVARMCAGYQGTLPRLAELYPRITAPTLVLWGERDRHFPPAHAQRLHQAISGSTLVILPEAEHWMAWHRAEAVAAAASAFLG